MNRSPFIVEQIAEHVAEHFVEQVVYHLVLRTASLFSMRVCSTSPSGGNQVDGLPPAPSRPR